MLLFGTLGAQQPGLITRLGIVHVVESTSGYDIMLDDHTLKRFERPGAWYPRIVDHISDVGPYAEVIMFQHMRFDSACDGRSLYLLALEGDGSSVLTNEVPYCVGTEPSIVRTGNRVTVTLSTAVPPGSSAKRQKVVWSFEKGRLAPSTRKR